MDKIEDISVLFFAGSNCCPDAFAPAHTRIAASALCNTAVDDRMAYISLSTIVGRLNRGIGHESEIVLGSVTFKAAGKFFGQFMIWRMSHNLQKVRFYLLHSPI